jgi:hypothetical protein
MSERIVVSEEAYKDSHLALTGVILALHKKLYPGDWAARKIKATVNLRSLNKFMSDKVQEFEYNEHDPDILTITVAHDPIAGDIEEIEKMVDDIWQL